MNPSLLHLMHLVSPALPVGAYAYSQGLEYAVDSGWLNNEPALEEWLRGVMAYGFGQLDAPILLRCLNAWRATDADALRYWNDFALACRETQELLLEDLQLGMALRRLLQSLNIPGAETVAGDASFASQFALACHHWNIAHEDAVQGFIWAWLENQIAAATKLVPLGQTQAQRLLVRLLEDIPSVAKNALQLTDEEIGWSLPGVVMASAKHERQYSRLFRS
jgi:urease accessory protein